MVARIKISKSLNRAFRYNENKVKKGVAELLTAENFPVDPDRLNEYQRLNVLEKIASLNPNLTTNTVHISLNFDPSETLSKDKLKEIAYEYMNRIGFGKQPYLLYQHNDSGHPHMHILTTRVALDGSTIGVHNIGKTQSEPARKEVETMFGLVKAEDSKKTQNVLKSAYLQKVDYGKTESKKAIASVLSEVIKNYKFTSLAELNAVLNRYNVKADRGAETSRTFLHNGLHYKIIDDKGKPVGIPIKASLFAEKPTLKYLEENFKSNETTRLPHKSRVKNSIDLYFLKQSKPDMNGLIKALEKEGIHTVLRQNEQGVLYGITYVDHRTKCVFNGSALGKQYSTKAIQERCSLLPFQQQKPMKSSHKTNDLLSAQNEQSGAFAAGNTYQTEGILENLLQSENGGNYVPYELSGKKKKRRKRKSK